MLGGRLSFGWNRVSNEEFSMRSVVIFVLSFLAFIGVAQASTLDDVRARGKLNCGVNFGLLGFALKDSDGAWHGFDVDYCRALAAAVLSDPAKVEFVPLSAQNRFEKLQSGEVDVLARNTTWTMERETKYPFLFAGVTYYDGQGFMLKKLMGVTSVFNMSQASICFVNGTSSQTNVDDFFKERNMSYGAVRFDTAAEALAAYDSGKCDAYSADQSQLYALRMQLKQPDDTIVLPDVISKEPLGPVVRANDAQWFNIARWTVFGLINAEELEIRGPTVDADMASTKSSVRRLLGSEGNFGNELGLDNGWAARAIKAVGNYGEIFERNLGQGSKLLIERGLNGQWSKGGILYAPPIR
jgi:general L-amino acid transport system substrate-binding protein